MTDVVHDLTQGWNGLSAQVLYACMEGGASPEELSFYERRIRANGGAALDQACGTGRHLFPLIKRGLEVHGADISEDALQLARRAAQSHGLQPALHHQRMEECSIPHRYGTIYIANGTLQIIIDRHVVIATLRRLWEHLNVGGQLLLELAIPSEVTRGPACHDHEHPTRWEPIRLRDAEGEVLTVLWSEAVDLFEQTLVSMRRYDLRTQGKVIRSEVHSHPMTWFFHHEAVMMLERAGFEEIRTYGD